MSNPQASPRHATPRWTRILIPLLLIGVWFAGAAIGGPYFGRVSEVSSNEPSAYLPTSSDAVKVQQLQADFAEANVIPAVVVFSSSTPLSEQTRAELSEAVAAAVSIPGVAEGASPALPSQDGLAAQAFVPIDATADIGDVVAELTSNLRTAIPDGIDTHVTGPAGFTADLSAAFAGIDGLLLLVALAAVLVILIAVYRSLLLPIAVLATSVFALTVALLTVWWLAKAGLLLLSGQTQGILFILVIGAATDYSLLYVARFREELRHERDTWPAALAALRGSFAPILASGGTVIAGLLCLLLSDLKSNSTLGPVAAIGIGFAMLAAFTLLPAVLALLGRAAFWPRRPHYNPDLPRDHEPAGLWARLGHSIQRRPRTVWLATTAALLAGAAGIVGLQASGVPQSALVLSESGARAGQQALGEHFPAGAGSPVNVVVAEADLPQAVDALLAEHNIDAVSVRSADAPSGAAPVTREGVQPAGPPGSPAPAPTVVNGQVFLQATLAVAADSPEAEQTVRDLRASFEAAGPAALVGGVTATALDTNAASIHDRNLIIPVVLAVIFVILCLLLRSVLAPLLLVLTTVLSFGTALGIAALVFNHVLHFPGADPAVPLFGFVFLVALGIDYNIFLMTRVREEALVHGTRTGIFRGLAVTGGVITSAGLVLAATFAALGVIPILFLAQIAFIVAFGVLLDTFVVRALLVPALFTDLGRVIWWPSRLSRGETASAAEQITD